MGGKSEGRKSLQSSCSVGGSSGGEAVEEDEVQQQNSSNDCTGGGSWARVVLMKSLNNLEGDLASDDKGQMSHSARRFALNSRHVTVMPSVAVGNLR